MSRWVQWLAMAAVVIGFAVGGYVVASQTRTNTSNIQTGVALAKIAKLRADVAADRAHQVQISRAQNTYDSCQSDKRKNRSIVRYLVAQTPGGKAKIRAIYGFANVIAPDRPSCLEYTKQRIGLYPVSK